MLGSVCLFLSWLIFFDFILFIISLSFSFSLSPHTLLPFFLLFIFLFSFSYPFIFSTFFRYGVLNERTWSTVFGLPRSTPLTLDQHSDSTSQMKRFRLMQIIVNKIVSIYFFQSEWNKKIEINLIENILREFFFTMLIHK